MPCLDTISRRTSARIAAHAIACCLFVVVVAFAPDAALGQAPKGDVKPSDPPPPLMYHGLIPGLSTAADVRKALGEPDHEARIRPMEVILFIHVIAMAFFVGGQIMLAATIVPVERSNPDPARMKANLAPASSHSCQSINPCQKLTSTPCIIL